jgi:hypothetical protein
MIRSGGNAGPVSFSKAVCPGKGNRKKMTPVATIHKHAIRFAIFTILKNSVVLKYQNKPTNLIENFLLF